MADNDDTCNADVASGDSLAITLAIVEPGENKENAISGLLPINMVTAIVSPMARPKPNAIAAKIPEKPASITAVLIVSQGVAPNALTPSRNVVGIDKKTSRQTAVIVGRIMTAKINPAVKIPIPNGGPLKKGTNPKY